MQTHRLQDADASFLIETCPYGIVSMDQDGLVTTVNQAFREMTGLLSADIFHVASDQLWKKLLDITL